MSSASRNRYRRSQGRSQFAHDRLADSVFAPSSVVVPLSTGKSRDARPGAARDEDRILIEHCVIAIQAVAWDTNSWQPDVAKAAGPRYLGVALSRICSPGR